MISRTKKLPVIIAVFWLSTLGAGVFSGFASADTESADTRVLADSDGDGVADDMDAFPNQVAVSVDSDDDGFADDWNQNCDTDCQLASGVSIDIDDDNNGLIEINSLEGLNAIRYDLAGTSLSNAEGESDSSGCPVEAGCIGYELVSDLDFDSNRDGVLDAGDDFWNEGNGWQPIGSSYSSPFSAVFEGNGHVINNLWSQYQSDYVGLFGRLANATVANVHLRGSSAGMSGVRYIGALAGHAYNAEIHGVSSTLSVTGSSYYNGGLIGSMISSSLSHSFAATEVTGYTNVGGLVGYAISSEIHAVYVTGSVLMLGEDSGGGIVGDMTGSSLSESFAVVYVDGSGLGAVVGSGHGTDVLGTYYAEDLALNGDVFTSLSAPLTELQCSLGDGVSCFGSTVFEGWADSVDIDGNPRWDFGDANQLPALRFDDIVYRDSDGDGILDNEDAFPDRFAAKMDSDADGAVDAWTLGCDSVCREASGLSYDHFPYNRAATADADLDGFADAWHADCDGACQADSGLIRDTYLNDTDNDGLINSEDLDDDGDGQVDADADSDGLIDINTLEDLDAIRYNLSGMGMSRTDGSSSASGCPGRVVAGRIQALCQGYELTTDLDFDTNGDGALDSDDDYWNDGEGWEPIGSASTPFSSIFDGRGYHIFNLWTERPGKYYQGLFAEVSGALLRDVHLRGKLKEIRGAYYVGALAGRAVYSEIHGVSSAINIYASGNYIGGLVGSMNYSSLAQSFVAADVSGYFYTGGIAGTVAYDSHIQSVYMTGSVSGGSYLMGGLVGRLYYSSLSEAYAVSYVGNTTADAVIGSVVSSSASGIYYAGDISLVDSDDDHQEATLSELQCATAEHETCTQEALFEGWSLSVDSNGDPLWDFGDENQLPALQFNGVVYRDSDGDGALDSEDVFPYTYAAAVDQDGDGAADAWTLGCDSDCREESGLSYDSLPASAAASVDTDHDGLPDAWNLACDSACQASSGLTLDIHLDDTDNDGINNRDDQDDNGDGEIDADADSDGLIEIASLAELDAMRYSLYGLGLGDADGNRDISGCPERLLDGRRQMVCRGYELIGDLDFDTNGDGTLDAEDDFWNEGQGWEPIGGYSQIFAAVFEGNGYVVNNLWIANDSSNYRGLFGNVSGAELSNVHLRGDLAGVGGSDYVGALVGRAYNSKIRGVSSDVVIESTGNMAGGIVGYLHESSLSQSFAQAALSGYQYVGGLVGFASSSEIETAFATGSVAATGRYVGGITGRLNYAAITEAFTTSVVEGNYYDGAVVGRATYSTVTKTYYASDIEGMTEDDTDAQPATLSELQCAEADDTTCSDNLLFEGWSERTDPFGNPLWDFGDETELPALVLEGVLFGDFDGDGVQDKYDDFPFDYAASTDADSDGFPDAWNSGCDTDCQQASGLSLDPFLNDTDNDGAANDEDDFPMNAAAALDSDGDGDPDAWLPSCDLSCQQLSGLVLDIDDDNDGVLDTEDAFPLNAAASVDEDGDGLPDRWNNDCDEACQQASGLTVDEFLNDSDNDTVTNDMDAFPYNPAAAVDTDGDNRPDNWLPGCDIDCRESSDLIEDSDDDNDGVDDDIDVFPTNGAAAEDGDRDGFPDAWIEGCDLDCQSDSGLVYDRCPGTAMGATIVSEGCSIEQWDDEGPEVVVTSSLTPTTGASIELQGTVRDVSGVANMYAVNDQFDGVQFAIAVSGEHWAGAMPLAAGQNNITIHAVDTIALGTSIPLVIERQIDRVHGDLSIISPTTGAVFGSDTLSVSGIVTSEQAANRVLVTVNGVEAHLEATEDVRVQTYTLSNIALVEGSNLIQVRGFIDYELYEDEVLEESIVVIYQPEETVYPEPSITILSPNHGAYLGERDFYITLNYASYFEDAEVSINGSPLALNNPKFGTANALLTFPIDQSEWQVSASVTDGLGRTATASASYFFDNSPPQILIDNDLVALADGTTQENLVTEQPYTITGTVHEAQLASFTLNGEALALSPGNIADSYDFSAHIGLAANEISSLTFAARDYSGNVTSVDYELRLDGNVSLNMLLPGENITVINQGLPIELQVAARVEGAVDGYTARGCITQNGTSLVEESLDIGEGIISGYMNTSLSAGEYQVDIELIHAGVLLTKTSRTFLVQDEEDIPLALTTVEPFNGEQNLETNTPITLYFNKTIDITKLEVEVKETAHGLSYVNTDAAGTEGFQARGYQLVQVDIDDEVVAGGLSVLPGGRVVGFYPEREFAYESQLDISVKYDGEEYSRTRFSTRALPTFIGGVVLDQFGQAVPGVDVDLVELSRSTTTDAQGRFQFGYGDSAEKTLPSGRFTLQVNPDLAQASFGSLQRKIVVSSGEQNNLGTQLVPVLNTEDGFNQLTSGEDIVLARGDLVLDTRNADIVFPGGRSEGFAMALFLPTGAFAHAYDPMFRPYWLFGLHPMGIEVNGELGVDIALPKLDVIDDYVWNDGAYLLFVGLDPDDDVIVPQGVGIVENHRVKLLRSEYQRLDYIGYAPLPGQAMETMKSYADGDVDLETMLTELRGLLISAASEGGDQ